MNPAVLGSVAALFWGVHDLVAGISSRQIGAITTVFGVTVAGLAALTLWLAVTDTFPAVGPSELWLPVIAGIGYASATLWLFAAFSVGPFSVAAPVGGSYPLTSLLIAAAAGVPTSPSQIVAALVVIAGVVLVAMANPGGQEH